MPKKKAFKKNYGFLSEQRAEKYSLFLKENLLKLKPKYYVVVSRRQIVTSDGVMYVLRITTDIECPFEPIVECWINGSDIYLWRDKCWGIAIDEKGEEIKKYIDLPVFNIQSTTRTQTNLINKIVIVFPIGVDEVQ